MERVINCQIVGANFVLEYIDDINEPLINICSQSKKDFNTLISIYGNNKEKLKSYFRKKINDVSYKIYDNNAYKLNNNSEEISVKSDGVFYTIHLNKKS
jgi:hypothetical protein